MGAWGNGIFENDTAADWVYQLEGCTDLSIIDKTLDNALHADYLDSDDACEALAAIETLTRLQGRGGEPSAYTEAVDQWVAANPLAVSLPIIEKSLKVIDLTLSSNSELFELWAETDELDDWKNEINDLRQRLMDKNE